MDYERIHKVQMGVISPSKLRMKLLGAHNSRRKESGSNSSRTSPSKIEEMKNAKNGLLSEDPDEDVSSTNMKADSTLVNSDASRLELSSTETPGNAQDNQIRARDFPFKEKGDVVRVKNQNIAKGAPYQIQAGGNMSSVHPVRSQEEDGNGYDSGHDNGSTSSFEFHRGERVLQSSMMGPFARHVPSKWNDAEKWIVNRQTMNQNLMKKTSHSQASRQMIANWGRIVPESITADQKHPVLQAADTKRIDSAKLTSQSVVDRFSFMPQAHSASANETTVIRRLQEEQNHKEVSVPEAPAETTVTPSVQSVSMRDIGTEMTPIPSQEPSRTGTPNAATTPSHSPPSSLPSTPGRVPAPSPAHATTDDERGHQSKGCKTVLSDREIQLKTRREIAALGLQLGKLNIASWATKDEAEPPTTSLTPLEVDQLVKKENEARAMAWEEAEKAKHMARYKSKEIKVQVWESRQKAKIEAQMRKTEVEVERLIARAQEKMMKKLATTQRRSEEKHAEAEARKSQQAARTAQQVEQIRRTGRLPSSHIRCCSWFL